MKVAVTGCAGFIGSHLCRRLLDSGFDVIGIDSLSDYYDTQIKLHNLESIGKRKNLRFLHADLLSLELENVLAEVSIIFHLAAQPGVRTSWGENFASYVNNNVLATQRLLEAVKNLKSLEKFVFASSSSVYGQTIVEKVNEEHPTRPFSPYGATKLAAEQLCSLYTDNYDVPTVSLRLFTVYGPGQRPDMAFAKLITAALVKTKFTVYGDGRQERDTTFVSDVVEGLVLAARHGEATGVFNIGGGQVVSLNHVITLVEEITNTKIQVEMLPSVKGDVRRTGADITRIKDRLGYCPKHRIRDGLEEQISETEHLLSRFPPEAIAK